MLKEGIKVSEREKEWRKKNTNSLANEEKKYRSLVRPWWTAFAEEKVRWKYLKGFYDVSFLSDRNSVNTQTTYIRLLQKEQV